MELILKEITPASYLAIEEWPDQSCSFERNSGALRKILVILKRSSVESKKVTRNHHCQLEEFSPLVQERTTGITPIVSAKFTMKSRKIRGYKRGK